MTNSNYSIDVCESGYGYNHFDIEQNTVWWVPNLGLKTKSGGIQSPAIILEHEFDHAIDYNDNPADHVRRTLMFDPQYETKEERRVIEGAERNTAKALKQAVRYDHFGSDYITNSPTSTTPYQHNNKQANSDEETSETNWFMDLLFLLFSLQ